MKTNSNNQNNTTNTTTNRKASAMQSIKTTISTTTKNLIKAIAPWTPGHTTRKHLRDLTVLVSKMKQQQFDMQTSLDEDGYLKQGDLSDIDISNLDTSELVTKDELPYNVTADELVGRSEVETVIEETIDLDEYVKEEDMPDFDDFISKDDYDPGDWMTSDETEDAIRQYIEDNDIGKVDDDDLESKVDSAVEEALDDIDWDDKVKDAVDDIDLSSIVKDNIDEDMILALVKRCMADALRDEEDTVQGAVVRIIQQTMFRTDGLMHQEFIDNISAHVASPDVQSAVEGLVQAEVEKADMAGTNAIKFAGKQLVMALQAAAETIDEQMMLESACAGGMDTLRKAEGDAMKKKGQWIKGVWTPADNENEDERTAGVVRQAQVEKVRQCKRCGNHNSENISTLKSCPHCGSYDGFEDVTNEFPTEQETGTDMLAAIEHHESAELVREAVDHKTEIKVEYGGAEYTTSELGKYLAYDAIVTTSSRLTSEALEGSGNSEYTDEAMQQIRQAMVDAADELHVS